MASNYTENLGLCQWEATDQVLREEFNKDNRKIDEVLAGKLGAMELILESVLKNSAFGFSVDLTGVDWNQWSAVAIFLQPVSSGLGKTISFSLDGVAVGSSTTISGTITPEFGMRLMVLFPMRQADRKIFYVSLPGGNFYLSSSHCFSDIMGVSASCNSAGGMAAGSVIRVYGIR